MSTVLRILTGLLALAATQCAIAEDKYPNKPVTIIVPQAAGGANDAIARVIAQKLSEQLGQTFVVDNRPGAGGNVGTVAAAKAKPDGYTLMITADSSMVINPALYKSTGFDPVKDFQPVSTLATAGYVLVANPAFPAKNMAEFIALAKAQPGKLSIAHGGNGTAMHLSAALFAQMADVKLVEIPYKGSGPVALDVLAGQVPLGVVDLPSALQHIKAGKLTAYAVTSPQRLPMLPDVPTVSEAGLAGYDSTGWFGVVAPAGTPDAVVARLNAEITAALNDEAIKSAMRNLGVEPAPGTAQAFDAYIRSETQKWSRVIKAANIKAE